MIRGKGFAACGGIAAGRIYVYRKTKDILPDSCGDAAAEQKKFEAALETARTQLQALSEKAREELGDEQAMIIESQMLMLDDFDALGTVKSMIEDGAGAAEAVHACGAALCAAFAAVDDAYMKARIVDIEDVSERLVHILCASAPEFRMDEPGIIVAEDLTPSETVQLPKDKILAFVTQRGSANSHTAILARIMNIPSLVQTEIMLAGIDGRQMIVDGFTGDYYIDPDDAAAAAMRDKQRESEAERRRLEVYRSRAAVTKTGRQIHLFANIGGPEDIAAALAGDAEGIGLLRSEFLYLGRESAPTEEELFTAYRSIVQNMDGRPVIIRTLDIGADKQADYFALPAEENPALGCRGIRLCLEHEEIFRPQLRAVMRASACGDVRVMFPMIASVWELRKAKAFCESVCAELAGEGVPFGRPKIGVMIETPAAALISDQLAQEADFFSVGTNDLTQYTLAADRQNAQLGSYCDPHHPAVLALLEMTARNACRAGISAGICGELGADPALTETFIRMGFDELSVSPGRILALRGIICESSASPEV